VPTQALLIQLKKHQRHSNNTITAQ
jgi:hypothetical protein